MTVAIADALHARLHTDPAYLGAMGVNFSQPLHLQLFRNLLCEEYRLHGSKCSIFYHMGENEDPDVVIRNIFEQSGFNVEYEDAGARHTIFDKYITIEHFKRVGDFKRIFARFEGLSSDRASDLALTLEELHPKLFDAFASAARTLERAETEEDWAQAALSGRRLLEKTADYLFPPRNDKWNGREVGRTKYKNRLWAYIDEAILESGRSNSTLLSTLGKEADRLLDLFNAGLHADPSREKVEAAFRDLVLWLTQVIELNPNHARRPYLAYEEELTRFMDDVCGKNAKHESG